MAATATNSTTPWLDLGTLLEGDLFEILGLDKLPEEKQDEFRLMVMESIRDRVLVRIVKELGPEKERVWLDMLDRDVPQQEIEDYLVAANVDVQSITALEAIAYKVELAERLNILKQDD